MRRVLLGVGISGLAVLLLARCSLIVGDYAECTEDSQCGTGQVCESSYCVNQTIPEGCFGVAPSISATYGKADAGNAIHLGVAMPFTSSTGTLSIPRVEHLNALVLALDEINGAGRDGVAGRPFVLHVCDTANKTDLLNTQVRWMVDDLKVPAVIIPSSAPVLSAAQITTPAGVLLMSATATSTEITSLPNQSSGGPRMVWRLPPSDVIQTQVQAELLLGTGSFNAGLSGAAKVAVLYVNDPYGQGLNAALVTKLTGGKTIESIPYDRGTDITAKVDQLNGIDPDVTVLVGFPEDVSRIISAAASRANLNRASGHKWLFTDSSKDPGLVVPALLNEVEGDYGTAAAQGAGASYAIFKSSFVARYSANPDQYAFISHNYDAMYLLALASAYAVGPDGTGEVSGTRLAQGMGRLSSGATAVGLRPDTFTASKAALQGGGTLNVDGTSGKLDFNAATGEAPGPIEIWQVDGGTIKSIAVVEPNP